MVLDIVYFCATLRTNKTKIANTTYLDNNNTQLRFLMHTGYLYGDDGHVVCGEVTVFHHNKGAGLYGVPSHSLLNRGWVLFGGGADVPFCQSSKLEVCRHRGFTNHCTFRLSGWCGFEVVFERA